jgi:hypothetical protein
MKDPLKTLMLDNRSSLFIRTLSDKGFKAVSPNTPGIGLLTRREASGYLPARRSEEFV